MREEEDVYDVRVHVCLEPELYSGSDPSCPRERCRHGPTASCSRGGRSCFNASSSIRYSESSRHSRRRSWTGRHDSVLVLVIPVAAVVRLLCADAARRAGPS